MSHEHRYAGFNSGGKTERRCQGCFQLEPQETAPVPAEVEDTGSQEPEAETAVAADAETETSGQHEEPSATLRRNSRPFSRRTDG